MGLGDILKDAGHVVAAATDQLGVTDAFKAVNRDVLQPVLKASDFAYRQGISRPVATTALYQGWDPLNFDEWHRAWDQSRHISPGQAIVWLNTGIADQAASKVGIDNPYEWASRVPIFGDDVEKSYEEITGSGGGTPLDINDPVQRQRVFSHGAAQFASGATDMAGRWFLDPTILGGKAFMLAKTAALVRPLSTAGDAAAQLARVDKVTADEPGRIFSSSRRLDNTANYWMGHADPNRRLELMLRDPQYKNNVAQAEFLSKSTDVLDFKQRTRLSMVGNNSMLQDLGASNPDLLNDYLHLSSIGLPHAEEALASASERFAASRAPEDMAAMKVASQERDWFKYQATYAKDAHDTNLLMYQAAGALNVVPRITAGRKVGDKVEQFLSRKDPTNGVDWWTWQPNRYNPVRVLKAASSRRPGMVSHDDPEQAVQQMTNMLNVARVGMTQRSALLAEFVHTANTGSPADVAANVQKIEAIAIRNAAAHTGVREDVVDSLAAEFRQRRDAVRQTLVADSRETPNSGATVDELGRPLDTRPDPVFSGARGVDEAKWADQVKNAEGVFEHHAMSVSDMANSTPLIDLAGFTKVLRRERSALNAEGDNIKGILDGTIKINDRTMGVATEKLDQFNRLWKPLQLMRLGWPIRVVVDEQMRAMAQMGAISHLKIARESLGNSLRYGNATTRFKDMATIAQRRQAEKKLAELGPARATGAVRATRVDKIQANMLAQGELTGKVTEAQGSLDRVLTANAGRRLYRADNPRANLNDRPHGVEYYLAEPSRLDEANGLHQRAIDPAAEQHLHTVASSNPDLGIAYLEDVLPIEDRNALRALSRSALAARIQRDYPEVKLAQYRSKDALLSVYGSQKARAAGIKGLERDGSHVLMLDSTALKRVDSAAEERALRHLDALRKEHGENAANHLVLTGKRDQLAEWTAAMEDDWNRLESRAAKPSSIQRGDPRRPNKFSGLITLNHNGMTVEANDFLAGHLGPTWMHATSADETTRSIAGSTETNVNALRTVTGDTVHISPVVPKNATVRQAARLRQTYDRAMERATNDQIGKDAMLRQIASGKTNEEILKWMRTTASGAEHVRRADSVRRANLESWVGVARVHVDHYLPDQDLRDLALQGRLRAEDVRAWNKGRGGEEADLPVIHGESLDEVISGSKQSHEWGRLVDKLYAKIGTAPTDVLSRHPYAAGIYRQSMQDQFERLGLKGDEHVTADTMARMERLARRKALHEVRRTLYDVANESNLAHTMRFVMPFYAAWQDALQTWGRLWMEDPTRLARMAQAWQAPMKSGTIYTDPSGKKYINVPAPKFVKDRLPDGFLAGMPANALQDLIFQGQYWYLPGFGAPVSVPVAYAVRSRPTLADTLKPVLPYGAGDSAWDQILPAGWKRGVSIWNKNDDEDYSKALFRQFQDVYTTNRIDGTDMTDQEMWDAAQKRTTSFFTVRMAANFGLPFSPSFRSPYQFYIDTFRTMQDQQRKNPAAFGTDDSGNNKSAQDEFLDQYGEDYFIFTEAATKSNVGGIPETEAGFAGFNKFQDLVREMPEMGSLIVGDTSGDYSAAVGQWMLDKKIGAGDNRTLRQIRDPKTAAKDAETNRGWAQYQIIQDSTDAALHERGLTNLRSKGAAEIKATRDAAVEALKVKYKAWGESFGTFDRTTADRRANFMEKLTEDPRTAERPGYASLAQYFAMRRIVVDELAKLPSHNLQAQANTALRDQFESLTNQLKQSDTYFATLYNRWLSSDDLDTGGTSA